MSTTSTGLSGLISNTGVQTTALPSWMTTAQQNVVNQATAANAAAPAPQNTVAQGAVNALSGPTNAFSNATGTLQSIASGAANPWTTNASGQVTPDTSTALGGLFAAQNQQLQTLMPQYTAPTEASNIASGNFGSLRGQTAEDSAMAAAQANLASQQDTAALQNQATGVQAGAQAGNVAQQGINNQLTVGQYQQASPYTNAANLGNVLSGINAGNTVSNTTNLSPLNQVAGLITSLGGSTGNAGVLGTLFGSGGNGGGLFSSLSNIFSSSSGNSVGTIPSDTSNPLGLAPGTYTNAGGGTTTINSDGTVLVTNSNGQLIAGGDSTSSGGGN